MADEWRVEIKLEGEEHGYSLGEALRTLDLDDEARERLGGAVIVTRDGPRLFLYAWHEPSAREAEQVARELVSERGLGAEVSLKRWHPVEETWKDASISLPGSESEIEAERRRREVQELAHARHGTYDWAVRVDLPSLAAATDLTQRLHEEGLAVHRRWRHLLVGAATEQDAYQLAQRIHAAAPEGTAVAAGEAPPDLPRPGFLLFEALKPGIARDLGL